MIRFVSVSDRRQRSVSPPQLAERPKESPYYTAKEAAAYLRLTYGTFRHYARQIKRCPGSRRYRREELDKWAESRRRN